MAHKPCIPSLPMNKFSKLIKAAIAISVESLVSNTNQFTDLTLYINALHGKWETDFNYNKQNRKTVEY